MSLRSMLESLPVIGPIAVAVARGFTRDPFDDSVSDYACDHNSGGGSYNRPAELKADFLNHSVVHNACRDRHDAALKS